MSFLSAVSPFPFSHSQDPKRTSWTSHPQLRLPKYRAPDTIHAAILERISHAPSICPSCRSAGSRTARRAGGRPRGLVGRTVACRGTRGAGRGGRRRSRRCSAIGPEQDGGDRDDADDDFAYEFAFGDVHECVGTASFEIPLADIDGGVSPGDTVAIAARAEVEDDAGRVEGAWGAGTLFVEGRNWATYFTYEVPAPTSCVCDDRTTAGGASGAAILAELCPDGELGAGVMFTDSPSRITVSGDPLSYWWVSVGAVARCARLRTQVGQRMRDCLAMSWRSVGNT